MMNRLTLYRPSYPVRNFPGLLGMLAHNLSASGGVAVEIIGTVLIVIASLLTQGIANVMWPNGQEMSIGANGVVVSPSASGKSLIFKILKKAIEQYLAMRSGVNQGGKHEGLLLEDSTREALVQDLYEWPVAGLITDEAGGLKRLLKDAPTLVKLLDGSPFRSARISTGRIALLRHRFSMLLMEQPDIFDQTKPLLGAGKGGVGLINRFFVVRSNDFRVRNSPHDIGLADEVEQAYEKRVHELLDALIEHVELGNHERRPLKLRADARDCLIDLDCEARRKCTPDSPWFFISEYISRHAERVLRLAGVFHVFEYGTEGEISLDMLQRAESFGNWYVESFAQIFYEPPKQTQAEVDADELENSFFQTCRLTGCSVFRQSAMRTQAMNLGLTPTRFNRALAVLCKQGRARMVLHRNVPWIELNISQLPQLSRIPYYL